MLDITHYHSLDERFGNGPALDALCDKCQNLNFIQLFSGPRYEDWDLSYKGDRKLDVIIGTVAEIRPRISQCKICHIVVAFHDALHTDSMPPVADEECDEAAEWAILKPFRTDVVLFMTGLSENKGTDSIATSLAIIFEKNAARSICPSADISQVGPSQGIPEQRKEWSPMTECPEQIADNNATESLSSANGVYEEDFLPRKLPRSPYITHNCLFTLTSNSFIDGRPVLSLSDSACGSTIDWISLRAWMAACEEDHPICRRKDRLFNDKGDVCIRCVDVKDLTIVPISSDTRYLALSYVWGADHREIREHIDQCILGAESRIMTHALPQTIRDGISVTKHLGERYLWVDCLCIKQNDPNDLAEQIGLMDRIYESALLTIVPATSADIFSQIPGLRSYSRVRSTTEAMTDGRVMKAICAANVVSEFVGWWSDRAWTYQEWLLSKRCLLFSEDQIMFRCQFSSGLESFAPPRADQFPGIHATPRFWADGRAARITLSRLPVDVTQWDFELYAELVRDYTRRYLSKQSDILLAFTGLMSKLEYSTGMNFVEGLPEKELLSALTWTTNGAGKKPCARREELPSWSWDGWTHAVIYNCWQIRGSSDLNLDFARHYRKTYGCEPPRSKRAKIWARHKWLPLRAVVVCVCTRGEAHAFYAPHRAYQIKRAHLSFSATTDSLPGTTLSISSQTRTVLIEVNSKPIIHADAFFRDNVMHPSTRKIIAGKDFPISMNSLGRSEIFDFPVHTSFSDEMFYIHRDAILLYHWLIEGNDGRWYERVIAMIINRLDNGTVERLATVVICGNDWSSLPRVKKVEHLVLV